MRRHSNAAAAWWPVGRDVHVEANPFSDRPDLEALAEKAVEELIASGKFSTYSGSLPPRAQAALKALKQRLDDESLLEDLFGADDCADPKRLRRRGR